MAKEDNTRSALLWEVQRLLEETPELPQVLLMENVPEVVGRQNIKSFREWRDFLEGLGYKNYIKFLNARHYGIPQNRNRCFMVSLLGDYYYDFPDRLPLLTRLRDILEENVPEKYYLSDNTIKYYRNRRDKYNGGFAFKPKTGDGVANTITTRAGSRPMDNYIIQAGDLNNPGWHKSMNRVISPEGICTTVVASEPPKILDPGVAYGYYTNASDAYVLPPLKDLSRTLKASMHDSGVVYQNRIRKLTPLECFRLMAFSDDDYYKCRAAGLSDAQLFKQCGNSIVVKVLEEIFKTMLPPAF
jgi:DNA (cytosine-5)-methyltransferase 1